MMLVVQQVDAIADLDGTQKVSGKSLISVDDHTHVLGLHAELFPSPENFSALIVLPMQKAEVWVLIWVLIDKRSYLDLDFFNTKQTGECWTVMQSSKGDAG